MGSPLPAWVKGGVATEIEPIGGLAGPGRDRLPNVKRRPSAVPPGMIVTPVNRSDGRIPAGGIAQARADAAGADGAGDPLGATLVAADAAGLGDGVATGAVVGV